MTQREIWLWFPFYLWENWVPESLTHSLKVSKPISSGAGSDILQNFVTGAYSTSLSLQKYSLNDGIFSLLPPITSFPSPGPNLRSILPISPAGVGRLWNAQTEAVSVSYWPLHCKWGKRYRSGFADRDNDFFYWTSSSRTSGVALGRPAAHRWCQLMIIYIYKTIVHQSGMNILEAADKSNCLCQMGACSGAERVLWLFLGWEVKGSSHWLERRLPPLLWLGDEGCVSTILKNPMSCRDWH